MTFKTFEMNPMRKRNVIVTFRHLAIAGALTFLGFTLSAKVLAQTASQPKPSPTPRRQLPKPVGGSRGFEQFAQRDAPARLVALSGSRGICCAGDVCTKR